MKTNSLEFDAQALKDKILDLAMRGKLVPQDPDDEPASVLLEKIKAEKEQLIKEKKIKKSKPLPPITDDVKPFDIPDSWEWVRLGDVLLKSIGGGTPSKRNSGYWGGNIPWISVKDVHENSLKVTETQDSITKKGLKNSSTNLIRANTLVAVMRMAVGRIAIIEMNACINQDLRALITSSYFYDRYLLYIYSQLSFETSGITVKGIKIKALLETLIPLPPLSEQKKIVTKIAQLFALLRKVESSAQQYAKLQTLLKSKVLNLAMRGKLVKQDPNDEPASVLLEKIKAEKQELIKEKEIKKTKPLPTITDDEKPFDIPDSWEWVRLGDVVFNYDDQRIPVSLATRRKKEKIYDYYGASGKIDKIDNYIFSKSLLLISEDGANLLARNKPIAFIATGKYWVNNHAHVMDSINFNLLKYISLYINYQRINQYISGSAQPKLNQQNLNKIPIPVSPEGTQKKIINKINSIFVLLNGSSK